MVNTHNIDEKENVPGTLQPPDKRLTPNSITSCPQFTPERYFNLCLVHIYSGYNSNTNEMSISKFLLNFYRSDWQEIAPTIPGIKEDESSLAVAAPETPKSHTLSRIRYPGDISEDKVAKMSPRAIVNSMRILKQACHEKETSMS